MIDFESNLRPREPMRGPRIVLFVAFLHILIGLSAMYFHANVVPTAGEPSGFIQHLLEYTVRILYFPLGNILAWLPDSQARGIYTLLLQIGWAFVWGLLINSIRKILNR